METKQWRPIELRYLMNFWMKTGYVLTLNTFTTQKMDTEQIEVNIPLFSDEDRLYNKLIIRNKTHEFEV